MIAINMRCRLPLSSTTTTTTHQVALINAAFGVCFFFFLQKTEIVASFLFPYLKST